MTTPGFKALLRRMQACRGVLQPWAGVVYRSCTPQYATKDDLLRGTGSRKVGGRWNPTGIAMERHLEMTRTVKEKKSKRPSRKVLRAAVRTAGHLGGLCFEKGLTEVGTIRAAFGVPRRTFARMMGASERTLADAEKGVRVSDSIRRRAVELDRLREALGQVVDPAIIGDWLDQPNAAFDGLKPIEVLERGQGDRIWRMIYYIESGVPG